MSYLEEVVVVGSSPFFCFFVTIYGSLERTVELTTKQIRSIIKEELQKLLQEQESKEALITRVLKAFKFKEAGRSSMVDELLDFFDQIDLESPDKEFLFKWMKVLSRTYPEFATAIDERTPKNPVEFFADTTKRKSLAGFDNSISFQEYTGAEIERRRGKRRREKLEQDRKEFIEKARAAGYQDPEWLADMMID